MTGSESGRSIEVGFGFFGASPRGSVNELGCSWAQQPVRTVKSSSLNSESSVDVLVEVSSLDAQR